MPFTEVDPLSPAEGRTLVEVAAHAIRYGLEHRRAASLTAAAYPPRLRVVQASFVTLEHGRLLRGCIGSIEPDHPLVSDVAANAYGAAFCDPRFEPLRDEELEDLEIHVSILHPCDSIRFESEPDLIAQLRPGCDGVILQQGSRRATFLPSVWESLPDPAEFLRALKHKAGIPEPCHDRSLTAWRYTVDSFEGRAASG